MDEQKYLKISFKTLRDAVQRFESQRDIIEDHLTELIDFQVNHIEAFGKPRFIGALILCRLKNVHYIVDGQHRFQCARHLCDNKKIDDVNFDVFIIDVMSMKEVMNIFQTINKCVPVPTHVTSPDDIVNAAFFTLQQKYPNQFVNAQRIQRPKIDTNLFKDEMIRIHKDTGIFVPNELVKLIENMSGYVKNETKINPGFFMFVPNNQLDLVQRLAKDCIAKNLLIYGIMKKTEYSRLRNYITYVHEHSNDLMLM